MEIVFILVEPQLGVNIGAVARAMSNFGLATLRIIKPRDGWPSTAAEQMSAHGRSIIDAAEIYENLTEALSDLDFILATSAKERNMDKKCISARELRATLDAKDCKRLGILFGRESSGLTNEEIAQAHYLVHIPTSDHNKALNLAQAAGIIAYELMQVTANFSHNSKAYTYASQAEIEFFLQTIYKELNRVGSVDQEKQKHMLDSLKNILSKAEVSSAEIKTLHGLTKAVKPKNRR